MKTGPLIFDRDQALASEPRVRHGHLRHLRSRHAVRAFGAHARFDRLAQVDAERNEMADFRARPAPLFSIAGSHPSS
jgi:hypothetical protein